MGKFGRKKKKAKANTNHRKMTTQRTVRVMEFVLLMFSLALQIVCLAAPGWVIRIEDSYDKYYGIFYFTRCVKLGIEECETTSWHDDYQDYKARTTSSDTSAVGALMIFQLSGSYIDHRYYLRSDYIDVGFPYCVLLYTVAFLSNVILYILYTREALKWNQPGPSPAEGVGTEGIILSVPGSNQGYSNMAATYAKN